MVDLSFIIVSPYAEVRFLGRETWAICTSDPGLIQEALADPRVKGLNAYITLNELKPDATERHGVRQDTLFRARHNQLVKDTDVVRRRLILFDSDSVKPTDTAATEAQRALAQEQSASLENALTGEGWPEPVVCDSGNGAHRLYSVDLPNNREIDFLISNLLHVAAREFDTKSVKLDKSVCNAGRITRLYGSHNFKARRDSMVLSIPNPLLPVTAQQIKALIEKWRGSLGYKRKLTARAGDWTADKMESFLQFYSIDYRPATEIPAGLLWVQLT